uniref:ATP synthase complex subunit 8 n=1 Tax=Ectomocoris horridus TaxID=3002513 RepID=A0A9E9BPC4_9HEMI|nr:ATP synthase F0 subunit 8 [Ectomocoris horridus]WAJ48431.1 ATP synthase F0 subunit 8 [Ectomocoris horridus]
MPQMAPLWWSILFLTFLVSFMMMCIIMHFQNTEKAGGNMFKSQETETMNWKW